MHVTNRIVPSSCTDIFNLNRVHQKEKEIYDHFLNSLVRKYEKEKIDRRTNCLSLLVTDKRQCVKKKKILSWYIERIDLYEMTQKKREDEEIFHYLFVDEL